MLKTRMIPTMLWKNFGLAKGVSFDSWRRVGTVLPSIRVYTLRQVDEIIFVDISATLEGRVPDYGSIAEFTEECNVPMTVGGGIREVEHVKMLLRNGADKVSINSSTYERPELVREAARSFGSQCIIASIDVRRHANGSYECFKNAGKSPTGKDPVEWARFMETMGAGEILLTSIERDGTMTGYDVDLIRRVTSSVTIPVIASGGAGNYEHMYQAYLAGSSALAAASIYHFTEQTPLEAKRYLAERGVPVRIVGSRTNPSNSK
jgi:cyclase